MEKKTFGFICFAVIIEAVITYWNRFFVDDSFSWKMLASIILGILVAVAYKLDLPEYFNLKSNFPYVGNILTGILLSRGANYTFDLINKLTNL
ncbi:MAG: hypothetical protein RUMPE_01195 [Eubacteriales bacterium SKADARSKE-1]|nr:hypothetical protein [Eubacteriales bacterium SKADARSKE-1]MDQ5984159.1 hypothetical protein [Eubacteriales bacterium SKADARSKE-1]